tara:strand:+ start:1993 stop:3249 length:1257 start_codon:yes stop_codon:yes gene_type:complete
MSIKKYNKIAIIGSGISGLTCAHILDKKYNVSIYEKNDYFGGHTHTHTIYENNRKINVDSGFIVYNENTYPNFIKLLKILKVDSQKTSMGFSVKHSKKDFEYSGNSLSAVFAKKTNLLNFNFLNMIKNILSFNNQSVIDVESLNQNLSLKDYLDMKGFSQYFINNYIIPMAAAIWSTPPLKVLDMPALFFIRFFKNHGLLEVVNRPQWWVIKNGSNQYVKKIIDNFKGKTFLNSEVLSVDRNNNKVFINLANEIKEYDCVIFATHSNQTLSMINTPSKNEKDILSSIDYQKNVATLHTDSSILPKRKIAWSSWNYLINSNNDAVTLTYNMNILQSLNTKETYCVTINDNKNIDENKILKKMTYHHPLFNLKSVNAQSLKEKINGVNNTYFCGAYWANGFHEDGVNSALDVCSKLGMGL